MLNVLIVNIKFKLNYGYKKDFLSEHCKLRPLIEFAKIQITYIVNNISSCGAKLKRINILFLCFYDEHARKELA